MIHFHAITSRGAVYVFSTDGDRLVLPSISAPQTHDSEEFEGQESVPD